MQLSRVSYSSKALSALIAGLACLLTLSTAKAGEGEVVGAVYPVIERDALEEMKAQAKDVAVTLDHFGDSDGWTATQSVLLPAATKDTERYYAPLYTLEFDIPDGKGGILYPKGFTFNPLEYTALNSTLYIVHDTHLEWAIEQAASNDVIMVSGGNALKATNEYETPIYVLDQNLVKNMDIRAAPSVVIQEGPKLRVKEFDAASLLTEYTLARKAALNKENAVSSVAHGGQ